MGAHDSLMDLRIQNQQTSYFCLISSSGQPKCLKSASVRRMCHASAQFRYNKPICVHNWHAWYIALKTGFDFLQSKYIVCVQKRLSIFFPTNIELIQKYKNNIFIANYKTHALLYSCVQSVVALPHVPRILRTWFCAFAISSWSFCLLKTRKSDPWLYGRFVITFHFGCFRIWDVLFTTRAGFSSALEKSQSLSSVQLDEESVYILHKTTVVLQLRVLGKDPSKVGE